MRTRRSQLIDRQGIRQALLFDLCATGTHRRNRSFVEKPISLASRSEEPPEANL